MLKIILGKESLLTKHLSLYFKHSKIFSSRTIEDINEIINFINKYDGKIDLIMNNFYPSAHINNIGAKDYLKFYQQSLLYNAQIFANINSKKINKIIYSSSSAVYNSIRKDYHNIDQNNKNLYSSTKIAVENLIYNFCSKNKISFLILRIFNMYSGSDDKFSIVSKLNKAIKEKKKQIQIFNKGENIRDYINVKDVVKLYDFFIKEKNLNNKVYDIGSGKGLKLIDILEYIGKNKFNLKFINKQIDEVDISIANNEYLDKFNFSNIENYFKKNNKSKKKISYYQPYNNNILQDIINEPIIYGTGNAAEQVYRGLLSQHQEVFCFVDDNKTKHNKTFFGKRIISNKELENLSKIKIINKLIIAIPSLSEKKFSEIKKKFSKLVNEISFIPLKTNFKSEIISLTDLINFETEYILGKKKRVINYSSFEEEFKNKNILVTGGAGSIGSQLVRQLLKTSCKRIIAYDNSEIDLFNLKNELKMFKNVKLVLGDINDKEHLQNILKKEKINLIFHAAAYKHVVLLEDNVQSALRNNVFGTLSVLNNAKKLEIPIITISTDKAVRASNVLGLTKRISELLCISYNTGNFSSKVVRFGNVFGSVGSAVPTFINQINNKLPITITNKKAKRFFMTLNDACFLLMSSSKIKNVKNVMILNMGSPIKILKIINSLIFLRKKLEPNYTYVIKEIGLQKGEKLSEELTISKKLIKTKNKDISIAQDPIYNSNDLKKLIEDLKLNFKSPLAITNLMKKFLYKDFKK